MQNILVVEDDMDIQELLREFLREAGYSVSVAGDGVEAMDYFSKNQYDLILLDIMLPKIDGFGVCELIRRQSQVPIIMLTALGGEEEQIRGLDLQVDDYIVKPFSVPVLIRKIAAVLRRSGRTREEERKTITYGNLVLTRQNLLDRLWRYDFYGDERVVDTHIKNLRKKLGIDFIQTVRGVGYKIDKET